MTSAAKTICRVASVALIFQAVTIGPSLAKGKTARRTPPPPPVALPCLGYAPAAVAVTGVLQRETFEQPPLADLFVDPNRPEIADTPPDASPVPAPGQSAAPPAPNALVVDPQFIGPLMPTNADGSPALPVMDPVLLRAKPVKRPPPTETVWVLGLRPDICVEIDPSDRINTSEKRVRKLQLVIDRGIEPSLQPLLKKKVVIEGQLFHAVTRRHYLPVLINVATIRPPQWKPELTEMQPLQSIPPLQPLPTTPPR